MIQFPDIDPVAVSLGPVAIHWYGISYVAGIALGWWLLARRASSAEPGWRADDVADIVFYAALGGVLGGRFGYILFYKLNTYVDDPLAVFAVWEGGMSIHGGMLGMALAMLWYARKSKRAFRDVSDFVIPVIPIGLGLGRMANFINQELWGAPTTAPWGVVFTHPAAGGLARHPSQLYEAVLEGLVLFVVLTWLARRRPRRGVVTGAFLVLYGIFRSAVEFVRVPDAHIGYLYGDWLTMGHVLCIPLVVAGVGFIVFAQSAAPAALQSRPTDA